jgi:pre-mRNA-splicing factor CWC22
MSKEMNKENLFPKEEGEVISQESPHPIQNNKVQLKDDKKNSSLSSNSLSTIPFISNTKSGGVYIPPYRMAPILETIIAKNDKTSIEYQKMMWDLLKKSINGIINKATVSNVQNIIFELFNENLIRGKGLLIQSITKAQNASPNFTNIYASIICVINSKLPDIGELIIHRYLMQFKKAYKRNNKLQCVSTTKMIAHLINQNVVEYFLAFNIIDLFLTNATDDSIELCCNFILETGDFLSKENPSLFNSMFEDLRKVLMEDTLDKRVQLNLEKLFMERKIDFKNNPAILQELDLVNDCDKIIHQIDLMTDLDGKEEIDVFKYDDKYEQNEELWEMLKKEILGEEDNDNNNAVNEKAIHELSLSNNNNNNKDNQDDDDESYEIDNNNKIVDLNEEDLIKLRRVIYLTIISSVDYRECCHKLLKLNMKEGQEMELVNMIIECCIQERTYLRFYGLLAESLCVLFNIFKQNFQIQFENQYIKVHRFETNKLRNLAKLFAHLLHTNAIDWSVLKLIKLTEEDTTASSRIFCKIVFQELAEYMGLEKLNDTLQEKAYDDYAGLFCRDNIKNTKFCINFFTSIGLGALTQDLREFLVNAEKMVNDKEEELKAIHQGDMSVSESDEENESDRESEGSCSSSITVSKSSYSVSSSSKSEIKKEQNVEKKERKRYRSRSRERSDSKSKSKNRYYKRYKNERQFKHREKLSSSYYHDKEEKPSHHHHNSEYRHHHRYKHK